MKSSQMDPVVQISEVSVKVCLIGPPCQPVHAGGRLALEREVRLPEELDADVVEERGELLLLPLPCCLPYALQRPRHARPAEFGACFAGSRSPWPRPRLRRLRRGRTRIVRRLPSYYGGV